MDGLQEQCARRLVQQLENADANCGFLAVQGMVMMRCPGAPYTDSPAMFAEADLHNAITLDLVEKKSMLVSGSGGSRRFEYYTMKRK
jgi:hypothetical protein